METILIIYFSIAGVHLLCTSLWLMSGYDIVGIDGFWDWLIHSLFWIMQPIKAIYKYFS